MVAFITRIAQTSWRDVQKRILKALNFINVRSFFLCLSRLLACVFYVMCTHYHQYYYLTLIRFQLSWDWQRKPLLYGRSVLYTEQFKFWNKPENQRCFHHSHPCYCWIGSPSYDSHFRHCSYLETKEQKRY